MRNLIIALLLSGLVSSGCSQSAPKTNVGKTETEAAGNGSDNGSSLDAEVKALSDQYAKKDLFAFDFSLTATDGKTVSKKDFAGKALIVDIWGTWCPPCREEVPLFVELQEKYREQGLQIVGIACTPDANGEPVERIKAAITRFNINYPCPPGNREVLSQIPGLEAFPTTLFIGRDGKVKDVVVGGASLGHLELLTKAILGEPRPQ